VDYHKFSRKAHRPNQRSTNYRHHVWLRRWVCELAVGAAQQLTRAVEHNISTKDDKSQQPSRRPDLSTFFSQLELVDTSDLSAHTNANALPQPENMAAAFRLLANAFETMRGRPADEGNGESDLLANMIEVLRENADDPPTELKGVPDSFLDELERVPKKALKPTDTCPICVNPFLEGVSCITFPEDYS
jgi:hypothetical protein